MAEALNKASDKGGVDFGALRRQYVSAAMADRAGGSKSTAVRHWLRFTLQGRRVSPIRSTERDAPLAVKLAEEGLLMDFAIWLVVCKPTGRTISVDTASKYVSTVRAWHERHFGRAIAADLNLSRLKDLLKGMRREILQPPKRKRFGVRTQHLAEVLQRFHNVGSAATETQKLNSLNWRAALSLGFCGLLRAAEMALQPGEAWDPELHLSRADVSFHVDGDGVRYAIVMMRPVKNGRHLRGKTVPLTLYGGSMVDAVDALWQLVEQDPVPAERRATTALLRVRCNASFAHDMSVEHVRSEVRRLMSLLGLNPAHFGAHSLRIGGATAAAAAGVPPAVIRCCGRWNSDIFEIYCRLTRETAGRMTRTIGSTAFQDTEREQFHQEELELLPSEMDVEPVFEDDEIDFMQVDEGRD